MKSLLRNEVFTLFISSNVSKVGIVFLIIMLVSSLYVVTSMPLDFGLRYWSNPMYWADNPKLVPPEWVNVFLGGKLLPHTVLSTERYAVTAEGAKLYSLRYFHESDQLPQTIVVKLENISFVRTPPTIELSVRRPDGKEVNLAIIHVMAPGTSERIDVTGRLDIAGSLSKFLRNEFNMSITTSEIIQRKLELSIIMGVPRMYGNATDFNVLKGTYTFNVIVRSAELNDFIGRVEVVIYGHCYGFMGTDHLGRDLAQVLLYGFPVALLIGVVTSVITTVIGAAAGIVSGYYGGIVDEVIQRLCDILNNIPMLPLLIFFMFVIRMNEELRRIVPPLMVIVLILIVFGWAGIAITIRSMVLSIKAQQFIEAALSIGASNIRVMFMHILPQVAPYLFAQMMFFTPSAILSEAALSLLGLSDPSIPTWGQVLEAAYANQAMYLGYWWWIIPPGLLIMYSAITFVFIAQGLEPIVEPRLRGR